MDPHWVADSNNNNNSYQSRISRNHSGVWQSGTDSDTFSSSEGNSWSSVSLSSSTKTNSAEPFPDEHFSRASSPGTVGVKSSMIDDISLEDVETFEERRLARVRVRRKVSRVDSLKKFLMFGSRLAEDKRRPPDQGGGQHPRGPPLVRSPLVGEGPDYTPVSCLEVHDRWLGVHQTVAEEEEEDNLSCLVNINMDIRSHSDADTSDHATSRSPEGRYHQSPDRRRREGEAISAGRRYHERELVSPQRRDHGREVTSPGSGYHPRQERDRAVISPDSRVYTDTSRNRSRSRDVTSPDSRFCSEISRSREATSPDSRICSSISRSREVTSPDSRICSDISRSSRSPDSRFCPDSSRSPDSSLVTPSLRSGRRMESVVDVTDEEMNG